MGFLSQTGYSSLCIIHRTDEGFYCLLSIFWPARISKSVRERKPHLSPVISFAFFHVVTTGRCRCFPPNPPSLHEPVNQAGKKSWSAILEYSSYLISGNVFKSVICECFKGVMESLSPFCTWKMKLCVAVKSYRERRVHISILYRCYKGMRKCSFRTACTFSHGQPGMFFIRVCSVNAKQ